MRISDWSSDVCSSDLYLEGFRRRNPRGFSALYMQRPTPQDGDFFKSDMVLPYKRADLPPRLRIYAASDHAVGTKQANDKTCLLIVGVDEYDNNWLLDCFWKRPKRSEERREGKECGSTGKSRWWAEQ